MDDMAQSGPVAAPLTIILNPEIYEKREKICDWKPGLNRQDAKAAKDGKLRPETSNIQHGEPLGGNDGDGLVPSVLAVIHGGE